MDTKIGKPNETSFYVGPVERIWLGKLERVCACCNLSLPSCICQHDQNFAYPKCPGFHSTFRGGAVSV